MPYWHCIVTQVHGCSSDTLKCTLPFFSSTDDQFWKFEDFMPLECFGEEVNLQARMSRNWVSESRYLTKATEQRMLRTWFDGSMGLAFFQSLNTCWLRCEMTFNPDWKDLSVFPRMWGCWRRFLKTSFPNSFAALQAISGERFFESELSQLYPLPHSYYMLVMSRNIKWMVGGKKLHNNGIKLHPPGKVMCINFQVLAARVG